MSMPLHDIYLQANNYLRGANTCVRKTIIHPQICCSHRGLCKHSWRRWLLQVLWTVLLDTIIGMHFVVPPNVHCCPHLPCLVLVGSSWYALPSNSLGILWGWGVSSSTISTTSCTMQLLAKSTSNMFKDCVCPYAIGSRWNTISTMWSMWTPSSTCISFVMALVHALVAHSSSESSLGLGPFHTWNSRCHPSWIKCSHTLSINLGLDLPWHMLQGHFIFYTPNRLAQENSLFHNLSSQSFCLSMQFSGNLQPLRLCP